MRTDASGKSAFRTHLHNTTAVSLQMSFIPLQQDSITSAAKEALDALTALCESNKNLPPDDDYEATTQAYNDEIERLGIWIRERGVREGKLDHKLRESSGIHFRVLVLLRELSGITDESVRLDNNAETSNRAGSDKSSFPHAWSKDDSNVSVGSGSLSLDTDFTRAESLPDTPLTHIHEMVGLLLELGPVLLDPTPEDRFARSTHPEAARRDIDHVRAIFPRADDRLVERLGRANWERRQYLMSLLPALEYDGPKVEVVGSAFVKPVERDDRLDSSGFQSDSEVSLRLEKDVLQQVPHSSHEENMDDERAGRDGADDTSFTISQFQSSTLGNFSTSYTAIIVPSKGVATIEENVPLAKTSRRLSNPPCPNELLSGDEFTCHFCAHKVTGIGSASEWK